MCVYLDRSRYGSIGRCIQRVTTNRQHLRRSLRALLLCLPLCCRAGGEAVPATGSALHDHPDVDWTSLRYTGSRFGVVLSTTLRLTSSSREEMQAPAYAALRDEPFQAVPNDVLRLDVQAHAETAFESYDTEGRVWFTAGSIAALQRDRLKPGAAGSRKIYRFARDGAYRIRLEPNGRGEGRQPPERWTKIKRSFYPYDLHAADCEFTSTPVLLLYLASSAEPAVSGARYCVFVDDALYRVWLEPRGEVPLSVDVVLNSAGKTRRISGRRNTLTLALHVAPITPGADPAAFELLELRGAIAIHVDRETRLPVLITGERAGAGELGVGLAEAVLRE